MILYIYSFKIENVKFYPTHKSYNQINYDVKIELAHQNIIAIIVTWLVSCIPLSNKQSFFTKLKSFIEQNAWMTT